MHFKSYDEDKNSLDQETADIFTSCNPPQQLCTSVLVIINNLVLYQLNYTASGKHFPGEDVYEGAIYDHAVCYLISRISLTTYALHRGANPPLSMLF